jgi:hypothetical protein
MGKKSSDKPTATVPPSTTRRVVDPAEKYYEQSRKDREAYKKAMKLKDRETSWADDYPVERNHAFGQDGNDHSRSGFDSSTFRSRH